MEQTRQIKQFQFYDFYAEILNGLNDESAGRIARLMCEYMFTDNAVAEIKDDKERFYWGNIVDVLQESKENEIKGKQSTGLNRKMKHFTFQDNFYDAIKLLDDKQGGQYCISFSQRKFAFYAREKRKETEGIRMIPVWDKKGKYKTIEDLSMQLDTCFAYLKEAEINGANDGL